MLTYATKEDFLQMKNIVGIVTSAPQMEYSNDKIETYLQRATRFIKRYTRRDFIPWVETKQYPVPNSFIDLARRRFPAGHLKLEDDLLEVLEVYNNTTLLDSDNYFLLEYNTYPKSTIVIKFPYYWSLNQVVRYDVPSITVKGIWGYYDNGYNRNNNAWIDTYEVVLAGGINATQTTIQLTDVDGLNAIGKTRFIEHTLLKIDNELMEITGINTTNNTITVIRGDNNDRGSTSTTHNAGVKLYTWRVIEEIVEYTLQIAKAFREQDISVGGNVGVSSGGSSAVEGSVPSDALSGIKSYTRSII